MWGNLKENGKRIFEGDIVQMEDWEPKLMTIAWAEGAFYLAKNELLDKAKGYMGDIYYLNHGGKPRAIVIGNIYDNPEQIKDGE